jgi:hypothetical protein
MDRGNPYFSTPNPAVTGAMGRFDSATLGRPYRKSRWRNEIRIAPTARKDVIPRRKNETKWRLF